jgi:uncharacterized protein (TIGR02284 family)
MEDIVMKTQPQANAEKVIANLNALLRGEISAVETYNQAISHLDGEQLDDLVANRLCHSKRVELLAQAVRDHGGVPETSSGAWGALARIVEKGASLINTKTVIAALEEGEDRGLEQYRNPGNLDPASILLIETKLRPRQLETHERMRQRKHQMQD